MGDKEVQAILKALVHENEGIVLRPGLSQEQFEALELKFGFEFPPDVRGFLSEGVPTNDGWHDWHALAEDSLVAGSEDDTVTQQLLWHATPPEGDPRVPSGCGLIPLCGHRMIPSNPCRAGNPVFSMHGCHDNIVYGSNLWTWLEEDHGIELPPGFERAKISRRLQEIPFWCNLVG